MRRLALSHGAQASSVAVGAEEGPRCSVGITGTTIPELYQDQAPGKRPALW